MKEKYGVKSDWEQLAVSVRPEAPGDTDVREWGQDAQSLRAYILVLSFGTLGAYVQSGIYIINVSE